MPNEEEASPDGSPARKRPFWRRRSAAEKEAEELSAALKKNKLVSNAFVRKKKKSNKEPDGALAQSLGGVG